MEDFERSGKRFGHAVVAGASMAGLLAARVLADHFERVTLLDRDQLPRQAEARKGVPQARHVHILLRRGCAILEDLFPGLTEELLRAGAQRVASGRELAWYHAGGWRVRHDSDLFILGLSRPLLEAHVAERVRALPNVTVVEGARANGLLADADGAVSGLVVQESGHSSVLEADLVINAMGRGSPAPEWLLRLGYGPVQSEQIPARVTYSTCTFPEPDRRPDWRALFITCPLDGKMAVDFPVEGGRRLVTLATFFDEPAPADQEAFVAFAKSLPVPDLYEGIRDVAPLSGIVHHRFPGSQRRRYDRLRRLPVGFLVIGDAVSSFNPIYGQGMTVAALQAQALGDLLTTARQDGRITASLGRRWFREAARIADVAWQAVAVEDFRLPELAGASPIGLRPLQWYIERVQQATYRSATVTDQFYRVLNFLDPPTALLRPRIAAEVLLRGRI
jgi:2-polyprenyl-6-methoxyphenol hydroxylase-like FAD-dependent oxidoreductase